MKRLAILGAGFAGLATAYQASIAFPQAKIVVFDPSPIPKRTSGIAAGLLHPFGGAHARLNMRGWEGMAATKRLLNIASEALGVPVSKQTGMLRVALTEEQQADFRATARTNPQVEWWEAEWCQKEVVGIADAPGLWIPDALQVDCPRYLEGLEAACRQNGVAFVSEAVTTEHDLDEFDCVIGALGAATRSLPPFADLPLRQVKGQVLEWAWPMEIPPLPFGLNAKAYLLMTRSDRCLAGATFERQFDKPEEDQPVAEEYLKAKVEALFPPLRNAEIVGCRAGLRAATPDHHPLVRHVKGKFWVLSGLGSKGLLYHALYAKELVELL